MKTLATKEKKKITASSKQQNINAQPRMTKVVINVGVGKHREEKNYLAAVERDLAAITGQKPQPRKAREAVSGFAVRQGNLVGLRVTLRGKRMNDFVQRFVHITLPRVRDFRGLPRPMLDGHGNLSIGLTEQLPFPEIHPEKTDVIFGLQVTFVTSARSNQEAALLFSALHFPMTEAAVGKEELLLETKETRAVREQQKRSREEQRGLTSET